MEELVSVQLSEYGYVINNLLHLVIVKYGVISLVLCISTHLRHVTILTLLVKCLVIFHADPCNKSYICVCVCVCIYIYIYDMIEEQNCHKKLPRCNITARFWPEIDSRHQCSTQYLFKRSIGGARQVLGQGHGRFSLCVHSSLLGEEVKQKKFMDEKEKKEKKKQ